MLLLNQDAVVNPALEVAAATEVVAVSEDAPLLKHDVSGSRRAI